MLLLILVYESKLSGNSFMKQHLLRYINLKRASKHGSAFILLETDKQAVFVAFRVCCLYVKLTSSVLFQALTSLVSKQYDLTTYELIKNFPRKNISSMHGEFLLEEVGIFPKDTIFIQEKLWWKLMEWLKSLIKLNLQL